MTVEVMMEVEAEAKAQRVGVRRKVAAAKD